MSFGRTNQWLRAIIPCREAYDDIWVFAYELVVLRRAGGVINLPEWDFVALGVLCWVAFPPKVRVHLSPCLIWIFEEHCEITGRV